ncbi:unnamed protein product [Soboliphyme baturini]|uniref:AA_TRNA_LIGASE_II domain-containing protein n=1 Tax=Soboliphyme baturini TaxID=241478 RepID=A0A183IIM7_9BILA|nr:unnamed protein product [Soboliphyme baturini]
MVGVLIALVFLLLTWSNCGTTRNKIVSTLSDDIFDLDNLYQIIALFYIFFSGLKNVYTFNPALRADKSRTREHLSEFTMLEVEMAFVENLQILLSHDELRKLLKSQKFHAISYDDALKVAGVFTSKRLGKNEEKAICSHFGNAPVFVTHFPSDQKPFYMKTSEDGRKCLCFDLLLPEVGEVCGGSLRECNGDILRERYLDLRKYGHPQLGGFGLGFERLLQFLLGIRNIRDCTYFPRSYQHCFG